VPETLRPRKATHDALGQGLRLKKQDQQAVHLMLNHLSDGSSIGSDHQASRANRLQHRPGEDEGVGQVDVRSRDLERLEEMTMPERPGEMHAFQIQISGGLLQEDILPPCGPLEGLRHMKRGFRQ